MTAYTALLHELSVQQETWLVTGAAGFIGSHLVEALLCHGQKVRGLDNFSTGHPKNLELIRANLIPEQWANFSFLEGDIRDEQVCSAACRGVDFVLHQAALGSVPDSIENPLSTHASNVDGFLNLLLAGKTARIKGFVYASSSAVYGDAPQLPQREDKMGRPLSPYAATKAVNELYAGVFAVNYGFHCIGLRYFNIFGERQYPEGPTVIPQWFAAALQGDTLYINGDGEHTRDFCFIENCVQATLLAAKAHPEAWDKVYNVAVGQSTSLNRLCALIRSMAADFSPKATASSIVHRDCRPGDIRHSRADISLAQRLFGYAPQYDLARGLARCSHWYAEHLQ